MLKTTQLPGYGLPYNNWGLNDVLVTESLSAVGHWKHDIITVRERCMLFLMNKITDKPGWERKAHDQVVLTKWRQEAKDLDWTTAGIADGDMTDLMFDFVSRSNRELLRRLNVVGSVWKSSVPRQFHMRRLALFQSSM